MKLPTRSLLIAILLPAVISGFWLVSNSRAATETPEYTVIKKDEKFEIRDYPALFVASAPMKDDMDSSFMQLFRFIAGANETAQKIEMTAPVLIDSKKDQRTMSFIVPAAIVATGVPKPTGENVKLGKVDASRFVALRFSGKRSPETEAKALEMLRGWMKEQKLTPKGDPVFAYYDPPWTPTFMRRNEVMLRIEKPRKTGEKE
ncbi:MAG: hypothetical protein RL088_93 [Verrucomicrobiota bacterium]|jgi:hypothetical protein